MVEDNLEVGMKLNALLWEVTMVEDHLDDDYFYPATGVSATICTRDPSRSGSFAGSEAGGSEDGIQLAELMAAELPDAPGRGERQPCHTPHMPPPSSGLPELPLALATGRTKPLLTH
jgi:hypothetical protein